ncbi:TetR family transcriptional regulator [Streptomyces decoyicus]|uniref:TetR family transcriptional regulator n=1 Tax=Streptomyces decoyicus TaxID=249567 RepID=A0ABZ1FBW6_9ACTN|nr:TetR family transcriptional regulator [Streptomyces decoyicus]WSB67646.1 TetR family transcriptional regulator [Streptomyces decoyicus]
MAAARGRPSLTEQRRLQTRLEIAETAAALFADRGYDTTTVEDIASAAGISLRTFYRYCPAKEDALTPLFASSVGQLVDVLAEHPADEPLSAAIEASFGTATAERRLEDAARARRLVRVLGSVPVLKMRWLAAGREMQERLAPALAARVGAPPDSLEVRLLTTAVLDAFTVTMEHWAWQDEPAELVDLMRRALAFLRLDELRAKPGSSVGT